MGIFNEKIVTEEAMRFWSSSNECNNVRAILAFSKDEAEANKNLRRRGFKNILRKKLIQNNRGAINHPDMKNIPYCTSGCTWGECSFVDTGNNTPVRWKIDTSLNGASSLTYFNHGDYLYINNSGVLTDKPSAFDKNSIYRYEGLTVNGVSISSIIDGSSTAFTKVSSTPNVGWDLTKAVEITNKNPIVPSFPTTGGGISADKRWHDVDVWDDTKVWGE